MASISFYMSGCSQQSPADLIISGGRIYTMNPAETQVEAVAVRGDRIVYAGTAEGANKFRGDETTLLDLKGKTVLPGLIDAHAHLLSLGRSLVELDLVGTTSPQQIRDMVLKKAAETPQGGWISGRGWDQNDWEIKKFPTWRDLDGTESHPVYLRRIDGHAAWVNQAALKLCGIDRNTPDPKGGKIIRDQDGEPTGVFIDDAADLIALKMPLPPRDEQIRRLKSAIQKCHSVGLVGVHDAAIDSTKLDVFEELHRRGELTLRVNAMLYDSSAARSWLKSWFERGHLETDDHYFKIRSVKLFADGALGSRGAALLEPYSDDPSNRGLLLKSTDELYQVTKPALEAGFQVCTHALGDLGVRTVLDAYERALKGASPGDYRLRIEHCEVISPADQPRFAALGVIPSMQPTHATSDMPWIEDRLGPERVKGVCVWRELLDSGCRIPCGSDFPVESPDPLWGIYAAVTRQDHEGRPEGGWYPRQKMTVEEAVRGFTIDAAYAEFAEDLKGSIEVGKLADFTILDRDIFEIPAREILDTQVRYTIVGGNIVYQSPDLE